MPRIAFTVTFVDGTSKEYSRDLTDYTELAAWLLARPYVRTPKLVHVDGQACSWENLALMLEDDEPIAAPAPARAAKKAPVAKAPVKAVPAPAPKHAPITQTRSERKASRAAKKAADAKAPKLSAHERRMAESPVYAATYTRDLPVRGHVTATMHAYKALVADFEQSVAVPVTRKARKSARKAA